MGVNEGVNIPPRGQISPLRAKFTHRGEVHHWGPGVKLRVALWTHNKSKKLRKIYSARLSGELLKDDVLVLVVSEFRLVVVEEGDDPGRPAVVEPWRVGGYFALPLWPEISSKTNSLTVREKWSIFKLGFAMVGQSEI
jgi:hypothetical protein